MKIFNSLAAHRKLPVSPACQIHETADSMRASQSGTALRFAIVAAQVLFLCSCASEIPQKSEDNAPARNTAATAAPNVQQDVTTITQALEKNGLNVSYSMVALPYEKGYMVRLSLVIRNMKEKYAGVTPRVMLTGAKGNKFYPYSKESFLKVASRWARTSRDNNMGLLLQISDSGKSTSRERKDWVQTYWIKHSYKIPPDGIEMGALIYHCDRLDYPLKLTLELAGQEFVFIAKDSLPVIGKPQKTG